MRILWLVKGLGPGGAERLLVAAAGAHRRDEFDIEVVYLLPWKDHLAAELEQLGVRTTCLDVRDERDLRWAGRLRAHLRAHRVDILHAHSPYAAAVGRLVVRTLPAVQRPVLVSTEHNPWSTYKWPTRVANAATAGLDAAVFAVSDEARVSMSPKRRGARRGPGARDRRRRGRDDSATSAPSCAAELGVGDDTVLVGTVANYHPKKDWPNLLHAARRAGGSRSRRPLLRGRARSPRGRSAGAARRAGARRNRDAHGLSARRDAPDGGVRHLRPRVEVGGSAGRTDGGECTGLADRGDARRRHPAGLPRRYRCAVGRARLARRARRRDRAAGARAPTCGARWGRPRECRSRDFDVARAVARMEAVYREVGTR